MMKERVRLRTTWAIAPSQRHRDSLYLEPSHPREPIVRMTLPSNVTSIDEVTSRGHLKHRRSLQFTLMRQLMDYLNEQRYRPEWLDSLHRVSETIALVPTYECSLHVEGPFVVSWDRQYAESLAPPAQDARARLLDRLTFKAKESK